MAFFLAAKTVLYRPPRISEKISTMINAPLRFKTLSAVLALAFFTLPGVSSGAEIFSWKDSAGRTHYSDVPPPDATVKSIRSAPAPSTVTAPPAVAPKSIAEQELDFRKRRAEQAEATQKASEERDRAEAKSRYCEQLARQIQAIEGGQRISRLNAEGVAEYLDDAQRQAELERSRAAHAKSCQ